MPQYIVGRIYTDANGKLNFMTEEFHETIDAALEDHAARIGKGYDAIIICKVLRVKTIVIDYDEKGEQQIPLGGAER